MSDFYIVDVFSIERYTGNQLAVFLNGHTFSTEQMQTLAREMHFSETSFIMQSTSEFALRSSEQAVIPIRIFTPAAELPFAGHPTLGTAFIIQQLLLQKTVSTVHLHMKAGIIPVHISYREKYPYLLTMTQNQPQFGPIIAHTEIAQCLGLTLDELDTDYPVQMISTGLPFVIVALKNRTAVQKAWLHLPIWQTLSTLIGPEANVLVFAPDPIHKENDLHVRVFVPELGISEDPATGSANGCLCAFLLHYGVKDSPHSQAHQHQAFTLRVEQGYQVDRPSLLYVRGSLVDQQYQIEIGGAVHTVARGELLG